MIYKFFNLLIRIIDVFKLRDGLIIFINIILSKIKINPIKSGIKNSELNNFIKKLFIYDAGYNLIRIGKKKDGSYLIPDILNKINYCFSPGVGLSTDFEDHLKKKKFCLFLPMEL